MLLNIGLIRLYADYAENNCTGFCARDKQRQRLFNFTYPAYSCLVYMVEEGICGCGLVEKDIFLNDLDKLGREKRYESGR